MKLQPTTNGYRATQGAETAERPTLREAMREIAQRLFIDHDAERDGVNPAPARRIPAYEAEL